MSAIERFAATLSPSPFPYYVLEEEEEEMETENEETEGGNYDEAYDDDN